jgi:ribosome-associated protein
MQSRIPQSTDVFSELTFTTARSSGPGGQNVNKVNSKVVLTWNVVNSSLLSPDHKEILLRKLATRLTKNGTLMLTAQDSRSQLQNKEAVLIKLDQLLRKTLTPKKVRKPTKPGKAAKRKRVDAKKRLSEKKQWRQKPE